MSTLHTVHTATVLPVRSAGGGTSVLKWYNEQSWPLANFFLGYVVHDGHTGLGSALFKWSNDMKKKCKGKGTKGKGQTPYG